MSFPLYHNNTIKGQLRECKAFAEHKDIALVASYIEQARSRHEVENRLEFQRLIKDSATAPLIE